MLSMKFPHLFLRPEIIITFLWGLEWSGGQVRHRSPRNSGFFCLQVSGHRGSINTEGSGYFAVRGPGLVDRVFAVHKGS